ncbi:hypothetical protein KKB55_12650, partial [Myxococcota bacterium]|nr:hypothetical protein [Myxococcota bacterium]
GDIGGGGGDIGGGGGEGGCANEVQVTFAFEDRLYLRGEVAELRHDLPQGLSLVAVGEALGILTDRGARWMWAPSYPQDGGVPAPWFTGPVRLRFEVMDGARCVGEAAVEVRLAGDVIVGDRYDGSLKLFASDGRPLRELAQPCRYGVNDVLPLGRDAGYIVGCKGRAADQAGPTLHRLNAQGGVIDDFEMINFQNQPLYAHEEGPRHLIHDAARGLFWADNGPDGLLYYWDDAGDFQGELALPEGAGSGGSYDQGLGFAAVDGAIWAGRRWKKTLWRLDPDVDPAQLSSINLEYELEGLCASHGGGFLVSGKDFGDGCFTQYSPQGARMGEVCAYNMIHRYVEPFPGGYLHVEGNSIGRVYFIAENGEVLTSNDQSWSQWDADVFDNGMTISGVRWLN